MRSRAVSMLALLPIVALAGCAADEPGATTTATPTSTSPGETSPTSETPADGGSASSTPADDLGPWYAFAFDREVTTSDGESGPLRSFTYTHTREDAGGRQEVRVRVANDGVVEEIVRAQKIDFASGSFEPQTVAQTLSLHKLTHELEVVEDTTGEHAAGDAATIVVYLPTEQAAQRGAFAWFFTKLDFTTPAGEGTWEYLLTKQMEDELGAGTVSYLPHTEGEDAVDWWGFDFIATTYGLGTFAGYATDAESFEEGTVSYGGFTYSMQRATFEVGAYEFRGWDVTTTAAGAGGSQIRIAPGLPLPVGYRFTSSGGSGTELWAFELTDVEIG